MSYGCEILFDADTAKAVQAEVRRQLGGECPCDTGNHCPLLPDPVLPGSTRVTIPVEALGLRRVG